MNPQIAQRYRFLFRGEGVTDQRLDCLRDDDLAAPRSSHDTGRPMYVDTRVVAAAQDRLADVNSDADAELQAVRPRVTGEVALSGNRCADGGASGGQNGKDRVALGRDDRARLAVDCRAHHCKVLIEERGEAVSGRGNEPRGALDI